VISRVNFTLREIDVMACIAHNRGYKKISSLLAVSHRTIHTHVRNINAKIRSNSREGIIDFVEESGQQSVITTYYTLLVFDSTFRIKLKELFNDSCVRCSVFLSPKSLGNIQIIKRIANTIPFISIAFCEKKDSHEIHAFITCIKYSKSKSSKEIKSKKKVFLLFNDCKEKTNISSDIKYVYFGEGKEDNYYSNIIIILESLYEKTITDPFLEKIKNKSINSIDLNLKIKDKRTNSDKSSFFYKHSLIIPASFFSFIVCLLILLFILVKNETGIDIKTKPPERIIDTIKSSSQIIYNQNLDLDQVNNNFISAVAFYKNITLTDRKIISKYFSKNLDVNFLILYLYNVHNAATFHNFTYQNIQNSQNFLLHSICIIENFLRLTNNSINNLDQLEFNELITELSVVKHLPELYTKIVYTLACTYKYLGDKKNAVKYFYLSRRLGEKLGLFEGFLSERSGLTDIELNTTIYQSGSKNKDSTKEKIIKIIGLYKKYLYTEKEFIINYKPFNKENNTIIPAIDIKNCVICKKQILKCYAQLILLTNSIKQQKYWLNNIKNILFDYESKHGILNFHNSLTINDKAIVYNDIANFLFKMFVNNIDISDIINELNKNLNLRSVNVEETIEALFYKAKDSLRSNNIVRLKSYNGLNQLYKFRIENNTLTEQQKHHFTNLIIQNNKAASLLKERIFGATGIPHLLF
jgi:DNA-binding CsgD family transcriptional regulator